MSSRTCAARAVCLIVAVFPVADEVDNAVFAPVDAPFGGDARHADDGVGRVGIHVEYRRVDDARHVGAVGRRAREARVSGEPDLVVDHDVNRAVRLVRGQVRQVERLGHYALAGHRCVAVDHNGHHLAALLVAAADLLRERAAWCERKNEQNMNN